MNVLIATEPDDTHAIIVKLALNQLGHSCELWFLADTPSQQTNSLYIDKDQFDWLLKNNNDTATKVLSKPFDCIWWRRIKNPFIPPTVYHLDLDYIRKENHQFHASIPLIMDKSAWWINSAVSQQQANSKPYQLKEARNHDLLIPTTLISNSPVNIKHFIAEHRDVIYKPFYPHKWCENNEIMIAYTKPVVLEQLPSDEILQLAPGIFQQKINKLFELRVTCFGAFQVAVKIDSQPYPEGQHDWRVIPAHKLSIEPFVLPLAIQQSIQSLMKKIGIVFGCFDFIVSPKGEYYFLEVNQQGQFLWIEDYLPEIKMLDIFIQFLLNRTFDFCYSPSETPLCLNDFNSHAHLIAAQQITEHVYLNGLE